jgi:hypothetical protein
VPLLGFSELCRPPGGSPFHTEHKAVHGCLHHAEVHFVLQGHWELTDVELFSLGNESPNNLVPHSGNICNLLLALELLGCSDWLLGQEGEVPGCSVADTGFLPASCLAVLLLLLRELPLKLLSSLALVSAPLLGCRILLFFAVDVGYAMLQLLLFFVPS